VGSNITVELQPGISPPARIVWFRDWQVGVEFLRPIDMTRRLTPGEEMALALLPDRPGSM
jgi:hypothetical protein